MARIHRGARGKLLCTRCATGYPPVFFYANGEMTRGGPNDEGAGGQLTLPFAEGVVNIPPLLMQSAIVVLGPKTDEGTLVQAVALPWLEIVAFIERDPDCLYQLPWQRVEELVAGAYEREGWDEVTVTPRSGDGGRDIVAVRRGICAVRIIDQVKAYSPGHRVSANDVRALLGVLASDPSVSKGVVTTTAEFAPRISEDRSIKPFIPYRLELKDGVRLRKWLLGVASGQGRMW